MFEYLGLGIVHIAVVLLVIFVPKHPGKIFLLAVGAIAYQWFGMEGSPLLEVFRSPPLLTAKAFYAWSILPVYAVAAYLFNDSPKSSGGAKVAIGGTGTDGQDNALSTLDYSNPCFTFNDVQGMVEVKDTLEKAATAILNDGKNGILLFGPPGNGKTFIAEAFAGYLAKEVIKKPVAFMSVSIAEIGSRYLGQTAEKLREMFGQAAEAARRNGACVLFLDEVDALLLSRSSSTQQHADDFKSVNAMLNLMKKYNDYSRFKIILIMATNFRDRLDEAAIRDGRVDFKIEIKGPDNRAIVGLLMANSKAAKLTAKTALQIAARWEGFSVSRVKNVAELAGKNAAEKGQKEVTFDDLMLALREAQGCKGLNLKAGTPSLPELSFDADLSGRLQQLAARMNRIVEIEAMGGTVPKGALFYGPPGTGKTAVAQALSVSSGWAFLSTNGSKLMRDASALDEIVKKASDLRPCILFIDEADDILGDRNANPHTKSDTNNLLSIMDGDLALKDVMFIAATNNPESLDSATLRGGRFSEHFEFTLPEDDALLPIIRKFIESKPGAPWAEDFTAENALGLLRGMSPANAKDALQKAINVTVSKLDGGKITIEQLTSVV